MNILIIEDEEKLAKSLKQGLKEEGFAVHYLLDGEVGQRHLEMNYEDYDLVILDVMLPNVDGLTICRQARRLGIDTPILMLTARKMTEAKVSGLESGADDYLTKPFSFAELLARVKAILRRPKPTLPVELKVNDLVLDPGSRTVKRSGEEVQLTLKEFGLLEYFMRHPNMILNREQILSHLWDFEFDSFSNVVDVHIRNLRKKLGLTSRDTMLESVRGIGYRLRAASPNQTPQLGKKVGQK